VQHHHAHAAACLAEHCETGPALAVVLDGTGFGTDGTIWGGEVLRADLTGFERVAHLDPIPLPGGETAVREPWRVAAAYLEHVGRPVPWDAWETVRQSLAVNAPLSSGAGRLFDAVSALLGVRERVTYEGQAAIELEHLAGDASAAPYGCRVEHGLIHGSDLIAAAHDDHAAGRDRAEIAAAFHEGVAAAFAAATVETAGSGETVVLSGGCLQNVRLLESLRTRLEAYGLRVLTHSLVPPNDGGVSYGQAAVAAARLVMCLGIPGQIVEIADRAGGLATVDVSGVRRSVSVALVDEPAAPIEEGDWVLVHVGFALARIDEEQARETLDLLQRGVELQRELDEMRQGTVA
jgi:hydrogenase maturation protein HypF